MSRKIKISCCIITSLLISSIFYGQPSLSAKDIINGIRVNVANTDQTFTVIRDALMRDQWYYMQNKIHLAEITDSGKIKPELSMIRYQFTDKDKNKKVQAILQFSVATQLPLEVTTELRDILIKKYETPNIKLTALPIKNASIALYNPVENNNKMYSLLGNKLHFQIVPVFASQKVAMSINLEDQTLIDRLITGKDSIPLALFYQFYALTPQSNFQVTIDYDEAYSLYSGNQYFKSEATWFGMTGRFNSMSAYEIIHQLEEHHCIHEDSIPNDNTMSMIDLLQPILAKINANIVSVMSPPSLISFDKAGEFGDGRKSVPLEFSVTLKSQADRIRGRETIDYKQRQMIENSVIATGFIGLNSYSKEVRNKLVTIVP